MVKIKDLIKNTGKMVERVVGGERSKLDEMYDKFRKSLKDGEVWNAGYIADMMLLLREGGESWNENIDWWVVEGYARKFRVSGWQQVW